MSQPLTSGNWMSVGTVGTVLVSNTPTTLVNVIFPGTYVGTVAFYDVAVATGTTVANNIINFGIPNTSVAGNIWCQIPCRKGLVYAATGTPTLTFTYE